MDVGVGDIADYFLSVVLLESYMYRRCLPAKLGVLNDKERGSGRSSAEKIEV